MMLLWSAVWGAEPLVFEALEKGVYRVRSQPYDVNTLIVVQPDGSPVLVDTPATPADTVRVLEWMEKELGRLPVIAYNSHFHADAAGGNQELKARNIPIVGSDRSAALHREHSAELAKNLSETHAHLAADYLAIVPTPPTQTFTDELRLEVGGAWIRALFPGAAHAPDNIVVLFEDKGVMYGGCMLKSGESLGYLGHADVASWGPAVTAVRALKPRLVVPGHGDSTSPEILDHTAKLVKLKLAQP